MPETSRRETSFGRSYARMVPGWTPAGQRSTAAGSSQQRTASSSKSGRVRGHLPVLPSAVSGVLAIEPDPTLRGLALAAAGTAPVPVRRKTAWRNRCRQRTPQWTSSSPVWCCAAWRTTVVLAEVVRVLRPGGSLLFYEHVRSAHRLLAAAEDLLTPLWSRVAGGCHPNRDTAAMIAAAGLTVRGPRALRLFGPPRQPEAGPRPWCGEQVLSLEGKAAHDDRGACRDGRRPSGLSFNPDQTRR